MQNLAFRAGLFAVVCFCVAQPAAHAQQGGAPSQCPITEQQVRSAARAVVNEMLASAEFGALSAVERPRVQLDQATIQLPTEMPIDSLLESSPDQMQAVVGAALIESGRVRVFQRGAALAASSVNLQMIIVDDTCAWGLTLRLNEIGGAPLGTWFVRSGG